MANASLFCVGIDWGTKSHRVCIVDEAGNRVSQHDVTHSGRDIENLVDKLHALSPEDHSRVRIGIETKHGAVVECLALHGFSVFSINPKQSDRFRDRHSPSGSKNDALDAFVIADSLRTDLRCFRLIQIGSPDVLYLRELTRTLAQIKEESRSCTNRLWQQLHRYYAPLLRLSPGADEVWLFDLLELAPTPDQGRRLRAKSIDDLLKRNRISRISAQQVVAALRETPLPVADGIVLACSKMALVLVAQAKLLHNQAESLEREIKHVLSRMQTPSDDEEPPGGGSEVRVGAEHDVSNVDDASDLQTRNEKSPAPTDAAIVLSLPGVGTHVASTLLSEAYEHIEARDITGLRAVTGVAAVTIQSGKSRRVVMRRACNARLRNAMHYWASTSIQNDAHMRAYYDRLRKQGLTYARALRGLAEHLLRILIGALQSGTVYDPKRYAENRPETVAA